MAKTELSLENIEPNLITLSFPLQVEKIYKEEYFNKSLQHIRTALLLSIFFFGIFRNFRCLDCARSQIQTLVHSLCGLLPICFLQYCCSLFPKDLENIIKFASASVVGVAGLGIIAMILFVPSSSNSSYYTGLILVFIFGYTFFKLDFIYASLTGILIVIVYEIAAIWMTHTPIPILINNNFFFLTGNLFGMFACYSIERYSRKAFLQSSVAGR